MSPERSNRSNEAPDDRTERPQSGGIGGDTPRYRGTASRRGFLRASAGALASAGLAAGAGCVATLPPLGRRVRYGRVDAPAGDAPVYRRWLPAPAEFASEHVGPRYGISYSTPSEYGQPGSDRTISFPRSMVTPRIDYFGVDYGSYDRVVQAGTATVLEGGFDAERVASTLADTGYAAAGSYREYELFERADRPRTVAVTDGSIVFVRGEAGPEDASAVVDAGRGARPRYHEVDRDFRALTDAVGSSPFTWIHRGGAPDEAYDRQFSSHSFRFDDEAVYVVMHWIYEEGTDVTEGYVRDLLEERTRARQAFSVDVEVDGRLATVRLRGDGSAFDLKEPAEVEESWPVVTWGFDRDDAAGTVTVRHEGGGGIDATDLELFFRGGLDDRTPRQFADEFDVVAPGDELVLDVSGAGEDAEIQLSYGPVDGTTVVLWRYDL